MKPSYLLAAVMVAVATANGAAQTPAVPGTEAELVIRPEAARAFPGRVQPILMNLCANCHCRADHPSGFKLMRVTGEFANAQATSRNLRAAAMFVRPENPSASPLLTKAITPHGGARDPSLTGRDHPAFKSLEIWAHWARPAAPPPAQPVAVFQSNPPPVAAAPTFPATTEPAPTLPPPMPTKPTATPRVNTDDPFDPEQFNRAPR